MQLQIEEIPGGFLSEISYKKQKESDAVVENVTENVTENREYNIIKKIKIDPTTTTKELAEQLKVTKRTILRDIEKLKEKGKIAYKGSAKRGYWEVFEYEKPKTKEGNEEGGVNGGIKAE